MTGLIIVIGLFAIAFNTATSFTIIRASIYTKKQKIWQALIVWFIPFVGAAVVWYIHKEATLLKSTIKDRIHDETAWDSVPPPPHRSDSETDHDFDAHD